MKDKKSLLVLLPVLIFAFTFALIYRLSASFAINSDTAIDEAVPSGTVYNMIAKNMYSWHLITGSYNHDDSRNASGTKLIESADGDQAVVYCASAGQSISASSDRKRYSLDEMSSVISSTVRDKWSLVLPYMYPYVSLGATSNDSGTLKSILKSSDKGLGGNLYNAYDFDKLNANEAITAVQAAIWNIQKSSTSYRYNRTISDFNSHDYNGKVSFASCSDYYSGKVITSEEQEWYNQDRCSSNGNFYKYVYNHTKDSNTENRINTLIQWYISTLPSKISGTTNEAKYFKVQSHTFDNDTKTMTINFQTNISDYDIKFVDNRKAQLTATKSGNSYIISNVADNVESITLRVSALSNDKNVYYYRASNGQDFIGLENGKYVTKATIAVERPEEPTPEDPTPEEPKKGNIIIYKVSGTENKITIKEQSSSSFDNSVCGSSATDCLSNSKFELYYESNSEVYKLIETNYSNTSTVVFTDLPLGTYYLKETQPAYGYDLYTAGTIIYDGSGNNIGVVGNDGLIKIELGADKTLGVVVNNIATKICFSKLDSSNGNVALAGAQYQIEDVDGMTLEIFETSANTGQEKYCLEGQLNSGSYFVREIVAPTGFALDSTKYQFKLGNASSSVTSLTDAGSYQPITVSNNLITFTDKRAVEISKSDMTTGACVKGAELVVRDSNGEIVKNSNGVEVGKWISTCECDNGSSSLNMSEETLRSCNSHKISLEPNKCYTLTENMTEELQSQGYSTGETIRFCLDEHYNVFSTDENGNRVDGPVDMKDAPIKTCIYKTEKGKKTPLAGATFNLYKEDGTTLYKKITTTSTPNNDCLTYIPFGTYYIKEIQAPNGYKALDETVKIEIKDTKDTQYFYIENEIVAPKTALDNTRMLIIISMVFMVFGVGLVGYYVIKKKN